MRNRFAILGALIVCIAVLLTGFNREHPKTLHARLGGEMLLLEIADTDELRAKGLSGHKPLKSGEGMLFIFEQEGIYGFWMKDMNFPIDIAWLDQTYRIVEIKERVEPSSYPEVFLPHVNARYVIELPEDYFSKHDLKTGNILEILK